MRRLVALLLFSGCPHFVQFTVAKGLGEACVADEECQGAKCLAGICVRACEGDRDCPSRSTCVGDRCALWDAGAD